MVKTFITIILYTASIQAFGQNAATIRSIQEIYHQLSARSDYIFIADTTLVTPLNIDVLLGADESVDTLLLKTIIEHGKIKVLTTEQINFIFQGKARFITQEDFRKIQPVLRLTRLDEQTACAIDSMRRITDSIRIKWNNLNLGKKRRSTLAKAEEPAFTPTELRAFKAEQELLATKEVHALKAAYMKADKRLLFFYPLIEYKQYTVLAIGSWQSLTNTYGIVRIISGN